MNKRDSAKVIYHTALPVIFGVKKYADALWKVVEERGIEVNNRSNLVEVNPDSREAIFENLDDPSKRETIRYEMLHVSPPMGSPAVLKAISSRYYFSYASHSLLMHITEGGQVGRRGWIFDGQQGDASTHQVPKHIWHWGLYQHPSGKDCSCRWYDCRIMLGNTS